MRESGPPQTLLQLLIRSREASYDGVVRELEEFARERGIDGTISARHLQRLARRERVNAARPPTALPGTRRLLTEFFGQPFMELVAPPPTRLISPDGVEGTAATGTVGIARAADRRLSGEAAWARDPATGADSTDPRRLTVAAAEASFEFLTWAENQLSGAVLDHVMSELQRLAVAYVHQPVMPIFLDLVQLRGATFGLLKNRPYPRQSRTLFFTAGTVCALLAHASQNLGNSSAARTQAAAAWACAEQADHPDLRAWVRGTQALIAEWTDSYSQAVSFSLDGQRYATGEQMVRLAAIEGRSLARSGDADGAVHAVVRAARARDSVGDPDELGELGGILTFPHAKQMYYAGSTLSLVGRHTDAEKAAREAISRYEAGSPIDRSYGDEALARIDVAAARLAEDDLDGMRESLAPVLQLPIEQRIRQISDGLSRVKRALALPRYACSASTIELTEHIADFAAPEGLPRIR